MPRFSIGNRVRIIGGLAEFYKGLKVTVIEVVPDTTGLTHLTKYRVSISKSADDVFYEFQLTAVEMPSSDNASREAST